MKKIFSILYIALLSTGIILAQQPDNRTAKTIIADVLAQIPAQNEQQFIQQQKELISTGETGFIQLTKMLESPDEGNKVKIEYVLSGLTHYVSAQGLEKERVIIVNAFLNLLDIIKDVNTKAFVISQLGIAGKDEAVAKLSSYLNDDFLCKPAAAALTSINSPKSGKALLDALNTLKSNRLKENVVLSIAEMQFTEAEKPLKELLKTDDENLKSAIINALSRVGSKASLPELANAAEKVHYTPEKTGAVNAYVSLIKRVVEQGDSDVAEKAAIALSKNAEKNNQIQIREAALQIQMAANPSKVPALLRNALKDKSKDYRNAALNYALDYLNEPLCREIAGYLKKADKELKLDILNWFVSIYDNPNTKGNLDSSYGKIFAEQLADKQLDVKTLAAALLAKSGNEKDIAALAKLLISQDEQDIALAKKTLLFTKGNIAPAIAPLMDTASDKGKIAILELLASRKSDKQASIAFKYIDSSSPEVKSAAYVALKDVVGEKDTEFLYKLLLQAKPENVLPVQKALIAALKNIPVEKQSEIVLNQINKTPKDKWKLFYNVLASQDNSKTLNFLVERFKTGDATDKEAAFQALLSLQGFEIAGELLEISKDGNASAYSKRALERYVQLVSNPEISGENRRLFLTNALELAKTDELKNEILKHIGQTGSLIGLLLAGEYLNQPALQQSAANAVMNIALNNANCKGKNVRDLLVKTAKILNNPDAEYQREAIRKHLDKMPQEEGFISVFNGKDLTGWKGLVKNPLVRAKMKPEELAKEQTKADEQMRKDWKVENGLLIFDGTGYDNICTDKQYGDFEMYIDWKLEPSAEADAGIYLRGTPQVQIWNTARTDVGAQVGSGGLYNNKKNPSIPLKVADNQLGEWNNFYIKMTGDRVTVIFNGQLVVDNIILENYWDASQPVSPFEQIELQAHGSKVYYRNIYVKALERPKTFELSAEEKKEGYKILFDGTNMHEWTGNTVDYILEDGCISMHPSESHGGNLYTVSEYDNFVFRFEFKLTPEANNGLGIRTPLEGDAAYMGMELQILDSEAPVYKDLAPYQYHGSVYGIIPAKRGFLKPTGEWNYQEVIANGDNIKITLNGTVILNGNIRDAVKNGTPDKQKHPGLFNKKGHIGFLGHGSHVMFKNIRIKELK
ncbi:MAG: DUF1080 domain-containing protein [Dysgonamonadaceae bacterium]|jgi:HEAT repeat protein|nr:DUF1080 domain-containing protein [Dysgonamonadaceae bacterium]